MAQWEGSAAFAARIEESVGGKPWFDYYQTMYPGYKNPPAAYTAFKYGSSAINSARDAWAMREMAREEWRERFGEDVSDWRPWDIRQSSCGCPSWVRELASGVHGFMTAETVEAT